MQRALTEAPTIKKQWLVETKTGNIEDYYEIDNKKTLGTGAFGTVLRGRIKGTGEHSWRAIKKIPKRKVRDPSEFANQIAILQKMDHPNIIKLYETFEDARNVYMVTEICQGGQLFDQIINKGFFTEEEARIVFRQMILALNYCHENKVAHRDLKPQNFLLLDNNTTDWPLKLIDFGLSFMFNKERVEKKGMGSLVGTSYYMAPEVMYGKYDQTCDIWSAGVILYILVTSVPPFNGQTDEIILEKVKQMKYTFDIPQMKNISAQLKDLITKILVEPHKRPTASQILEHPWLNTKCSNDPLVLNYKSLRSFCSFSKLKKIAMTVLATQLQEKDILEMGHLFKQIDKNNDGMISIEELKHALETQKQKTNLAELQKLIDSIDSDRSGTINYTEFIASCLEKSVIAREDNLLTAFRALDTNGDGKVTRQELKRLLEKDDFKMNPAELDELINSCDKNKDGVIDYNEFIVMMTHDY